MKTKLTILLLLAITLSGCSAEQQIFGDALVSTSPVVDVLNNKTSDEKANIKGQEIAKLNSITKTIRAKYDIEIVSFNAIKKGVEVFVSAWTGKLPVQVDTNEYFYDEKGKILPLKTIFHPERIIPANTQIGFGKDGTVDIEKFVIINPPILVSDPQGDIIREWFNENTGKIVQNRYREDLQEALLQSLEHTISVKKEIFNDSKIIFGSIGRTTLTAYPAAGSNAPFDGRLLRDGDNSTWATIRGEATSNFNSDSDTNLNVQLSSTATTNQWSRMYRILFGFTTSSIGSDEISSAVFSVYGTGISDNYSQSVVLDKRIPASDSGTTNTDYDVTGWDGVRQATSDITVAAWNTSGYNNFTLNGTGEGNINKSGYSWFGLRLSGDFDNTEPTWQSEVATNAQFSTADVAGTTEDPKLVVEHSAAAAPVLNKQNVIWFK